MTHSTPAGSVATAARPRPLRFGVLLNLTLLAILLLIWTFLALTTDSFLSASKISNLMRQASLWAIIAVGQTFVIVTAGIDLSVGAVVGLAGVLASMMMVAGVPVPLAIAATLGFGVLVGMVNAFGITRLGLPPFIMTLAGLTSLRGVGLLITNGQPIAGLPASFTAFSRAELFGAPSLFWMVVVVAVPAYVLLHLSRPGRYLFAVGSNAEAVRLSGVSTTRTIYLAYVVSAVCASLAGILAASRLSLGIATTGESWELQSIAAAVIGGCSLFGAVGSIPGPLMGALLLSTINQGANLLNVNPFWQRILTGLLIVAIVYVDQLRRRKRR